MRHFLEPFKKFFLIQRKVRNILFIMDFPEDSSISSKKTITMKIRKNLGHFGTEQVKGM